MPDSRNQELQSNNTSLGNDERSPVPHQFETVQLKFRDRADPIVDINTLLSMTSPDQKQGGKSLVDSISNPPQEHSLEDLNEIAERKKASNILENEKRQIFFYQPKYLHPESLQVIAQNLLDEWEKELLGLQEQERKRKEGDVEGQRLGNQPKEAK